MGKMGLSECLLGGNSKVEGTLESPGLIRIEGDFRGHIISGGTVVIAEGATVSAEINAADVVVAGIFDGTIAAKGAVHLTATAEVKAEIVAGTLGVDEGGRFSGSFRRSGRTSG